MKKFFLIAAVCSLALWSCNTDFEDSVNERLDAIEGNKIPSANAQITSINNSLDALRAADKNFQELLNQMIGSGASKESVEILQNAISLLESRIQTLQNYTDSLSQSEREWCSALFCTQDQYDALAADLAKFNRSIDSIISKNNGEMDYRMVIHIGDLRDEINIQLNDIRSQLHSLLLRISAIEDYLNSLDDTDIILDPIDEELAINAGDTISFKYTLVNTNDQAIVTASSDGNYKVKVSDGLITVICPTPYTDGFINVMLYDTRGFSKVKVIRFYERQIQFVEGDTFPAICSADTLTIPVSVNYQFFVSVSEENSSWISESYAPTTKAEMERFNVYMAVAPNTDDTPRTGTIFIHQAEHPDRVKAIQIIQQSALLTMDNASYSFTGSGSFNVAMNSANGLSFKNVPDWISNIEIDSETAPDYVVDFSLDEITDVPQRSANIDIYDSTGTTWLGIYHITQYSD